jgi:hypothetical protein
MSALTSLNFVSKRPFPPAPEPDSACQRTAQGHLRSPRNLDCAPHLDDIHVKSESIAFLRRPPHPMRQNVCHARRDNQDLPKQPAALTKIGRSK